MSCRFVNIVRPGDMLTFAGIVCDIVDGVVIVSVSVTNDRGEEVLAKAVVEFELSPPDIVIA
jgi:acyl dehydratase